MVTRIKTRTPVGEDAHMIIFSVHVEPNNLTSFHHQAFFDADDPEDWDMLWLMHHDIELALDNARPGTFNPLPAEEQNA